MRITNSAVVCAFRLRPLPSGSAEELTSVNNLNGTYANLTWPFSNHSVAGLHAPLLNGTSSTIDLYTAALNTAMSKTECSISVWAKVASASVWTDSTKRVVLHLGADANNFFEISRTTSDDQLKAEYKAGGTSKNVTISSLSDGESPVTWFHLGVSASATSDALNFYVNGVAGTAASSLGSWSGNLNSDLSLLGSSALGSPADVWSGGISDLIIYSEILTDAEMLALSRVP